jgi:hypothetical protein
MDPAALMALARHSEEVATVRDFQTRSSATRVVLLVAAGEGTTMVEADADANIAITEGDAVAYIPANAAVPAPPKALPDIRTAPATAIHIDTDSGELAAPLGTVEHLASSTLALAKAFGGLTVAAAEFATDDPELPITFAAREGEPVVLAAGDATFEL